MGSIREWLRSKPERVFRAALLFLSRRRSLGRLATRLPFSRSVVSRYVVGETLDEALPALERLRAAGLGTTVDLLGESVTSVAAARAAADGYVAALGVLAGLGLDVNASLKLSQMGLGVDPAACRDNVARILETAAQFDGFVRIDMEDHTTTDATLRLWEELRPAMAGHGDVGVVLQSALRRSPTDVEALIRAGARVRLCKGAYREPAAIAHRRRRDIDTAFVALMERLLRDGTYPAIATHDAAIIGRAVAFARANGVGPERFEFQMLYGIRRDLQEALVRDGWRVRVYVPFGREWWPYFMRRLAERPANVLFVVRGLFSRSS